MNQGKMYLLNKIFNNDTIRTVWDKEHIVGVISGSDRPRKYWRNLKKIKEE